MKSTIRTMTLTLILIALSGMGALAQSDRDRVDVNRIVSGELDEIEAQEMTPEDEAIAHYQQGVALVGRGLELQAKLGELDSAKREKAEKKIERSFEGAIVEFGQATAKDPSMLDAWVGLGWTYRKTGQWAEAVGTYDAALALAPGFAEALAGRGEALLALNRLDEARQTYERLAVAGGENAAALLAAMEHWVRLQEQAGHTDSPAVQEMVAFVTSKR